MYKELAVININFADKLNQFIVNGYSLPNRYDYFSCGYANDILQACGLDKNNEIVITQNGMKKILGQKVGKQDEAHDLTPIEALRLPQLIQKPILIITGNTHDTRLIFVEMPRKGRKMFAVIFLNYNSFTRKNKRYNLIASVYSQDKSKIDEKIRIASISGDIWYYDSRKIKNWLSEIGELQLLPKITTNSLYSEKDFQCNKDMGNILKGQKNLSKKQSLALLHLIQAKIAIAKAKSLNGIKKTDSKANGFFIEILISKTSLSQISDLQTTTGLLSGTQRATRAFRTISATATSLRGITANIADIGDTIKIFENKIKNWDNDPIDSHYIFILYVLSKLPPKETSRFNSYYVVDEKGGNYRIRISSHNAKSINFLNKNGLYKVGITFKRKSESNSFESNTKVFYKENVYYTENVTSNTFREILKGIVNVLKGGLYDAPCDKELFSPSKKEYEEKFYSEIK